MAGHVMMIAVWFHQSIKCCVFSAAASSTHPQYTVSIKSLSQSHYKRGLSLITQVFYRLLNLGVVVALRPSSSYYFEWFLPLIATNHKP
eukprot:scaffold2558_cov172-Amphora_coffeaeformis.AAC.3